MVIPTALVSDYLTIFFSILVEALPFVTLGVLVSGVLTIFIKDEWILKFLPRNRLLSHVAIAFLGFVFPVCECGNVPVARRLIEKGLPVPQAITFLLAAPVLNPIVILSTYVAFRFAPEILYLRVGISFLIAVITGLIVSYYKNPESLLTDAVAKECAHHHHLPHGATRKVHVFFETIQHEILEMAGALIVGASIAAITTTLSRGTVLSIAQTPLLATLAMMFLALIMSICSTVDAFVALGYYGRFPMSSVLAFLIFGPMIDFRVISMLKTTFKWKLIITMTLLVAEMIIISSVMLNFFGR